MQKILAILFGILLGTAVLAQDSARVTGVEETIQRQIEAFLVEDVDAAFAIASPTIQQLFGTSENFGRMVQMRYPMVWNPSAVAYVDQRARADAVMQLVKVTDSAGADHWFAYEMVRIGPDWRINGVYPVQAPAPNV